MRAHHCRGNQRFCLKLRWGELSQSNSLSRNHCVRGGWHSLKNSSTWRRKTPIQRTFSLPFPSPIHPGFEAGDNLWNFTMLTKRQPSYWDCTLKASGIWTWICSLAKRIIAAPRLSSSFHFFSVCLFKLFDAYFYKHLNLGDYPQNSFVPTFYVLFTSGENIEPSRLSFLRKKDLNSPQMSTPKYRGISARCSSVHWQSWQLGGQGNRSSCLRPDWVTQGGSVKTMKYHCTKGEIWERLNLIV